MSANIKYIEPEKLKKNGVSATTNKIKEQINIFILVVLMPAVTGSMGIFTFLQSSDLYKLKAQKCDGVQKNIIKKSNIGSKFILPVAMLHPITGGKAPAAPPITIFWGVILLSQIVYTMT